MSLPRLARVQRIMRKGIIFRSQWQLLGLGGGLQAICVSEFYLSCIKTVSVVEGGSSYFMCRLEGGPHYVMQWQEQAHEKLCIVKLNYTSPPPPPSFNKWPIPYMDLSRLVTPSWTSWHVCQSWECSVKAIHRPSGLEKPSFWENKIQSSHKHFWVKQNISVVI